MQKSTNYGLNLPDLSDQFNLNHWNENTEKLDLELKKETDSRINNDNQLQSNINNSVSTLRNEISTAETNAKNLANATGVLSIAKGGTEATDAKNGFTNLANGLEQSQKLQGSEYMIYKSGGNWGLYTFSQFWEYIKIKISLVLGLTGTQYNGNAKTATKLATTRTINIQDASATNTGTEASFDGSENATIKLPSTIKANITGNCSGSSGSCTGNSATATYANHSTDAYNAYRGFIFACSTGAGTASKTISIDNPVSIAGFTLVIGACIRVLFKNGNSVANPTLNVNNTGAKEIRVIEGGTIKPLSSYYGDTQKGAYYWKQDVILELYYNGSYWVAINNPIIAQKTTCTDGTTADKPAYSCRLDGYKEIYGSIFLGDVTINSGSKQKFLLPITMGSSAYNASIALRQNNLALLGGDAELSYYGDTTSLTINMWNGNTSDPINDAVLTWIIKGY